ncbi:7-cyano-7-deazaguanine synthase QueC [Paludibacter sp. 221]|uniref:7-cyano-7-deazaguanine synthase QueC n=1 Tax=Paludibacter sp. 221 TaxID=2302939 RepID=UPI0013D891B2|nr:7-cyano-7-deazaguanine synthase QueC [Paludibacter sp. 221]NDV46317.1 7-cyano-7-deazaguanine synthase QueC [Paludibacter sp. 221]
MRDSIILYSGGLDSTVALYKYAKQIQLALSFNYGSKHNAIEIKKAASNCQSLGIEHRIIELDLNKMGFVSDLLTSGGEIPEGHYEEDNMKKTVVPFRNGIMLSIAAGIAESMDCKKIIISNHAGDHAIYPDCREEFILNMNNAIKSGTYNQAEIFAPFTNLTKREIALIGKELNVPFERTYSCYKGQETHCGTCGTCTERKEALNGFDNTVYQT